MRQVIAKIMEFRCPTCDEKVVKCIKLASDDFPICKTCQHTMEYFPPSKKAYWKPYTPGYHRQLDQTFHSKDEEVSYAKRNGLVDISGEMKAWKSGRGRWKNR